MNKTAQLAVIGGDVRQVYLAQLLQAAGHRVSVFALERHPAAGCEAITNLQQGLNDVQAVLLPLPVQQQEGRLNAPLANESFSLATLLDAIPPHTLTLAGAVPFWLHARAVQNELRLLDYLSRSELAIRNAVPTCEGAIQLAMEQTPFTIQGARILVIGAGRIGFRLARKLHALGAAVTLAARSSTDFARIAAEALPALDSGRLSGHLSGFTLVFNTVPAPLFGAAELHDLPPGCLLIDLASLPGGIAPDAVIPPDRRVLHALSLPGRVAPLSAAQAIADTVQIILQEEGIL